ncbi:DUF1499 domain-containing protein [uncultured Litoreibacter sp.]|uniref:DUF1499 domain-containing protein n=1 Tax=uncultured Litoreibacter sp. TaxID=1392394 RepID=UPI0026223A72|nr:DUF1499 domain-containing protein [uncultured Litoreibacter sp.]
MIWKSVLAILVIGFLAGAYFVRSKPLDTASLHIDPETAERPGVPGHVLLRAGADIEPPVYEMDASALALRVEAVILSTPRTEKLAGELADGYASYVTRSALWGFPDIASVKVVEAGEGKSSLIVLSRLRYGQMDMGVNRARVEDWLAQLSR